MSSHRSGALMLSAGRRHTRPDAGNDPRTRRPGRRAGLLLLIATLITFATLGGGLSYAGPGATPAASPGASPVASPVAAVPQRPGANIIVGHVTVEITDTGFVPDHFESAVGRNVTINLVNSGSRPHNFTLAAFDIDIDLAPGETASAYIPLPDLGDYHYTSDAAGDEAFSGTMIVFI
jgi:hypothetical protein